MLIEKVKKTVEKFGLIRKGERIVVAVSGGTDSTALLFALCRLKDDYDLRLYIAHLDHMVRSPQETAKDHQFVCRLAERLDLPVIFKKADVLKYAGEKKLSLEEAGRNRRYEFLLEAARDVGASKIALGHTLDDQTETILMRLIRGSGLRGLRGIPPLRVLGDKLVIRPLIEVWRREINAYLRRLNIKPLEDATNLTPKFFRNRVRHEVIGFLRRYNPNIKEALARAAQNLTYDYEILADTIERVFVKTAKVKRGAVTIKFQNFEKSPIGLKRGILRRAIELVKGDLRGIDYSHIEKIEGLIAVGKGALELPDKIRVTVGRGSIVLHKVRGRGPGVPVPRILKRLSVPGITLVPELGLSFEIKFAKRRIISGKPKSAEYIDCDKIAEPLFLRTWKKGDRFRPLGMRSEKKLQDLFVDEKIPKGKRGLLPLVVCGRKIIWVCGLRLSEDVKITNATKRILRISYSSLTP